jgi:uncharacterized protein with NRDE domain
MCVLALALGMLADSPQVVFALREESYRRPWRAATRWEGRPVSGPKDLLGGGTWIGLSDAGFLVAVVNRAFYPQSALRSRGLLVVDLLDQRKLQAAAELAVRELSTPGRYAGCCVVLVGADEQLVVDYVGAIRVEPLVKGIHVITRNGLNPSGDQRAVWLRQALSAIHNWSLQTACRFLETLSRRHLNPHQPGLCVHGAEVGTICSDLVALDERGQLQLWWETLGPPCRSSYHDRTQLCRAR